MCLALQDPQETLWREPAQIDRHPTQVVFVTQEQAACLAVANHACVDGPVFCQQLEHWPKLARFLRDVFLVGDDSVPGPGRQTTGWKSLPREECANKRAQALNSQTPPSIRKELPLTGHGS
jgi:hypothetical protein